MEAGVLGGAHVHEALDAQRLRRVQQRGQLLILDAHLALVHELEQRAQFAELDVLEDDDGVLVGVAHEQLLEEGGARRQDDLVRAQRVTFARQRHVHQQLVVQQLAEHAQQVVLVVVPAQAVPLAAHRATCNTLLSPKTSFWPPDLGPQASGVNSSKLK